MIFHMFLSFFLNHILKLVFPTRHHTSRGASINAAILLGLAVATLAVGDAGESNLHDDQEVLVDLKHKVFQVCVN